jgi:transcriptional regulator GlxA family with amidase domain
MLPPVAGMPWSVDFLPSMWDAGHMRKVVVIVQDQVEPFGLGSLVEVWDEPYHPEDDNPQFDFSIATPRPGVVKGRSGFDLVVEHGLDVIEGADLVAVAPHHDFLNHDPAVLEAVRSAHAAGAMIFGHCSAAFTLGAAGLLDGRSCTTHWRFGERLATTYPEADVCTDVLYVEDEGVLTGAGAAAGIDASLHLMRRWYGARTAATTARRIVVPPHRDGGQAQFVKAPVRPTPAETLAPLLESVRERLAEQLTVDQLAREAHMSPRTFARRFKDETGTTPLQWVTGERIALAQELLEQTAEPVESVAARVGFGNAATLRHHFAAAVGLSPQAYRKRFSCVDDACADGVVA